MALKDIFNNVKTKIKSIKSLFKGVSFYSEYLSATAKNPLGNDTVRCCIKKIATECAKLTPKHVKIQGDVQTIPNSAVNALFLYAPNPLMTTNDFIYKTVSLLLIKSNVFIYPLFEDGQLTALYPLNPDGAEVKSDETGELWVEMQIFDIEVTLPYSSLIHLRLNYTLGEYLGTLDDKPIMTTITTSEKLVDGLSKAVETSFQVRGLLKLDNLGKEEKKDAAVKRLEEQIKKNNGIIATDLAETYVNLPVDPKLIDKDTIKFIDNKIIRWYGLSEEVLNGNPTDEQHEAFFNGIIEYISVALSNAFTKTLFTRKSVIVDGNRIKFYASVTLQTSLKTRLQMLDLGGQRGLFTVDQQLELIRYPPIGGEYGAKRLMSLNYISSDIIDEYQMKKRGEKDSGK